jgi:hypothetical protein
MKLLTILAALVVTMGISIIANAAEIQPLLTNKQTEVHQDNYVPGMGEIMGLTQMRHSKLWFAGDAKNWELANYELDEIKEGLNDASKFHPVFKKDAPIAAILDEFMSQPLSDINNSIIAKNRISFRQSFDRLTNACNACHKAASQGFIVITRPRVSPVGNQEFATKNKKG